MNDEKGDTYGRDDNAFMSDSDIYDKGMDANLDMEAGTEEIDDNVFSVESDHGIESNIINDDSSYGGEEDSHSGPDIDSVEEMDCGAYWICLGSCGSSEDCKVDCAERSTDQAKEQYNDLIACAITNECNRMQGEEMQKCLENFCENELNSCLGD